MARHPFDPVSFVLGGVAIAAGAVVLADRSLTDDARVLLPAGLIALGIALFAKVVRGDARPVPADPAPSPSPARSFVDPPVVDAWTPGADPAEEVAPWPAAGGAPDVPAATSPTEVVDRSADATGEAADAPDGDPTALPGDDPEVTEATEATETTETTETTEVTEATEATEGERPLGP